MTATMLEATLWLAVAATSVTVCASWGLAQALARMKESATQGFILATSYPLYLSRAPWKRAGAAERCGRGNTATWLVTATADSHNTIFRPFSF